MLLRNAKITMLRTNDEYGLIDRGALAIENDKIAWVGADDAIPAALSRQDAVDLGGRLITPSLVDCHSHIVYGGNRAQEFENRLLGASYEEIARAGGGILSSVTATRAASLQQLTDGALPRIDRLIAEGVTLIEVKSGYGLDRETELKMLRAARQIAQRRNIEVLTTYLGAHTVPPEYSGAPDAYIDEICIPTLRAAHAEGLVDAVDGFCETIAFDKDQISRLFDAAKSLGLPVKLHAEQLSHAGGSRLAARYGALSADHLEYATGLDVSALRQSGTVAVLLPGAFYTLREKKLPPIEALRAHAVPIAVATDCNPGTSPMTSILLAMNMACTLFRLTPLEALLGVSAHACAALGLTGRGRIVAGAAADLCVWDADHPAELSYNIGFNPLYKRIFKGATSW